MNLVSISIDTIPLGKPLPFALRSSKGVLLAQKGYVIRDRQDLETLVGRGTELCFDSKESADSHRAYLDEIQGMLLSEKSLGQIASVQMSKRAAPIEVNLGKRDGLANWHNMQLLATQVLRSPRAFGFLERFNELLDEMAEQCLRVPDATLLALIQMSGREPQMYSATHGMLVACVCMVVARSPLGWSEEKIRQVASAAFSMNCAMTELQDLLAVQPGALTAAQIVEVETHASRSADLLQEIGVDDPVWIEAVRQHHQRLPGPLKDKTEAQQLARMLQRADIFAARLAPRASRAPMPVTAAMQLCYHDEERKVDEVGAAIIKALGVYPPGTYVRLATQETAVVLRRGNSATTPRVAVILNREGMPTGEPIPRDTAMPQWKITGVVPLRELRVQVSIERLVAMV